MAEHVPFQVHGTGRPGGVSFGQMPLVGADSNGDLQPLVENRWKSPAK